MGIVDQLWERIRDLFTDEELNDLIIQERMERERREREEQRPTIQIPLEPPPSVYDEPEISQEEDEKERGVIIIDI
jgi:hypothetical protein